MNYWNRRHWNQSCRCCLQARSLRRSWLSALIVASWLRCATFPVRCFGFWFVSRFLFWCSSCSSKVLRSPLRRTVHGVQRSDTIVSNNRGMDWFGTLCSRCMTLYWWTNQAWKIGLFFQAWLVCQFSHGSLISLRFFWSSWGSDSLSGDLTKLKIGNLQHQ